MYSPQPHQGPSTPSTKDEPPHTQEPLPRPSSAQLHHRLHNIDTPSSPWSSATVTASMEHDFANLCLSPLPSCWTPPSYSSSTFTTSSGLGLPIPSPMLLLHDPSVEKELGWIARKLVKSQRHHSFEDGAAARASPNLFVILPMAPSGNARKFQSQQDPIDPIIGSGGDVDLDDAARNDDFRLFFLCDYGEGDDSPLKLHICEDDSFSPPLSLGAVPEHGIDTCDALITQGYCSSGGFQLRDLDEFLTRHTLSMLALLRALNDNDDPYVLGTGAFTSTMAGPICAAIRFLATRAHGALLNLRDHPLVHDDELEEHHAAVPRLQENDFWFGGSASNGHCRNIEATNTNGTRNSGAAIMGGGMLHQAIDIDRGGSLLWQCRTHNDLFCAAPAEERLRLFIKEHKGIWIPIKRTIEIRLKSREDANVFYEILGECNNCVEELGICLAWRDDDGLQSGVTEADLWRLAEAVHMWNLRGLVLDCGGGIALNGGAVQYESNVGKQNQDSLQFRPLLGMICRTGLESFAVEGFDGAIFPGGVAIQIQGSPDAFSLQQLRESDALVIPENISLKKLAFRRWKNYPDVTGLTSLAVCCTDLTEIESQAFSLEAIFFSLHRAIVNLGNLTFLNISESSGDSAEITIWKLEEGQPAVRKILRRASNPPSRLIQAIMGLEHWSIVKCARLWEHPEGLHNIIHNNVGSLKSMDIVCEIEFFTELWLLIMYELMEAEAAVAAVLADKEEWDRAEANHAQQVTLVRLKDLKGHCLESLSSQRMDETSLVLNSYDGNFRLHMEPLSRIATTLSLAYDFTSTSEMELLLQHVAADGLWFNELAWFLTPQTRNDAGFMAALQMLVRHHEVHTLTIRIDGGNGAQGGRAGSVLPMKQIQTLLQIWNDLTGMSLGRNEYGRWMQELAAQLDHPFRETLCLPTGAGELTFASEDVVKIGAPPVRESALVLNNSQLSASEVLRGPVIYALSCRCL